MKDCETSLKKNRILSISNIMFDPWVRFSFSGAQVAQRVRSLDLTAHTSLSPIRHGFVPSFVNYKKGCTRLAAASDLVLYSTHTCIYQIPLYSMYIPANSPDFSGSHPGIPPITRWNCNVTRQVLKRPRISKYMKHDTYWKLHYILM
jgi:hypothetical protein